MSTRVRSRGDDMSTEGQHILCCTSNRALPDLSGHTLKSARCDYGQRHVIMFLPISVAARSWSYDNVICVHMYILVRKLTLPTENGD